MADATKPRKLKVFALTIPVRECPPAPNGNRQALCVVAAPSQKAAAKAFGVTVGELRNYGSSTSNTSSVAAAIDEPGVVFWRPLYSAGDGPFRKRKEAQP